MSNLAVSMGLLMQTFDKYAGADGNKKTLSKAEFKALLENEMCNIKQGAKDPAMVDQAFQAVDFNGDSEVNFEEFVTVWATITCACYNQCSK